MEGQNPPWTVSFISTSYQCPGHVHGEHFSTKAKGKNPECSAAVESVYEFREGVPPLNHVY
jgi:hypothetical protein